MKDYRLSLIEHLAELRNRIIIIALAVFGGAILSYTQIDLIVYYILKPAGDMEFIYLSPPELFTANIKLALISGFFISLPITTYQIWAFLKPGLKKAEQNYLLFTAYVSFVFFTIGAAFAYFAIIPMTIEFFVGNTVDQVTHQFTYSNYVNFSGSLLLAFGLVFQLPLLVLLLTQLNLVQPSTFKKYRKYFILVIFVIAAVLTPPDVVSQILMALPMILLYEFSISLAVIIQKRKIRKIKKQEKKKLKTVKKQLKTEKKQLKKENKKMKKMNKKSKF